MSDFVSSSITQAAGRKKFCACKTKDLGNELVLAVCCNLHWCSLFQWTKLTKSYITGRLVSSVDLPASSRKMEDASSRFAACCWLDLCLAPNEMNCVTFFSPSPRTRNDSTSRPSKQYKTHTYTGRVTANFLVFGRGQKPFPFPFSPFLRNLQIQHSTRIPHLHLQKGGATQM